MLPLSIALLLSAALVLANAFFVASEFASVKIRPTRLEQLVAEGNPRARVAQRIGKQLDAYLSANQLGITLASLGLGWLGEPAFASLLRPWLEPLGTLAGVTAHTLAAGLSFATITLLHVVLGELVPKSIAIQYTEPVALWTALPLRLFYLVAFPLIWVFNGTSVLVLKLLGMRRTTEDDEERSPEELRLVLRRVKMAPQTRRLIDRVFDYMHHRARHVMTLRQDVAVLHAEKSFAENLETAMHHQFTRYPLVGPDETLLGFVHLKDLATALADGRTPAMRTLAREPIYVSEDTPLEVLRREFQLRGVHLAIVRNARAEFVGIVTLEDLLEEFVGEIRDEQDAGEVPPIVKKSDGGFEADGRLTLDVVEREFGIHLPDLPEKVETLGGYIRHVRGDALRLGDTIDVPGYRLTVLEARDRRVRRVRGDVASPGAGDDL